MYQNRNRLILGTIIIGVVVGVVGFTMYYFISTRSVSVHAKNVVSFSIAKQNTTKSGTEKSGSTKTIRLKKGKAYSLNFLGAEGYSSGNMAIIPDATSININPDYSAAKLAQMLESEIGAINSAILGSGTSINELYSVERGQLSHYGEWYFTTLKYKGSVDDESSDTLVVGLQKKQGSWIVMLSPGIIFTTADYPDTPREFIDAANAYQNNHVTPTEELYYR